MKQLYTGKKTLGDIGVELEMETRRPLSFDTRGTPWRVEFDGSLRGNGYEFVMRKPLSASKAVMAVKDLYTALSEEEVELLQSGRAGTHVHINVQTLTAGQIISLVCSYLALEECLMASCGKERSGNLFCLRLQDARYLAETIVSAFNTPNPIDHLRNDNIRYASVNLTAIPKYGSLEFRGMRSSSNSKDITSWITLLWWLKVNATKYKDPREVYKNFSEGGAEAFVKNLLGKRAYVVTEQKDWEEKVMRGVRLSQEIAYLIDWDRYL